MQQRWLAEKFARCSAQLITGIANRMFECVEKEGKGKKEEKKGLLVQKNRNGQYCSVGAGELATRDVHHNHSALSLVPIGRRRTSI